MRRLRPEESEDSERPARSQIEPEAPAELDLSRLALVDPGTRAAVLGRLQQGSGNANVGRMLARQAAGPVAVAAPPRTTELFEGPPPANPDLMPHGPGEDSDTAEIMKEAKGGDGASEPLEPVVSEVASPEQTPAPTAQPAGAGSGSSAPTVDPAIVKWAARAVATNPDYAQWLLDGAGHGFLILENRTRPHLESFAQGGEIEMNGPGELGGTVSGAAGNSVLGTLEILRSMVLGRANRWIANPSVGKQPFQALSLARNLRGPIQDAHSTGEALDAGGFDWEKPRGARQVIQVLEDLPPGRYKIGLPFQGSFFDPLDSLMHFRNDAVKAAEKAGGDPADVTTPGLVEWRSPLYTARWVKGAWVEASGSGTAVSKIKDDALRGRLGGFNGKTFLVMPDRPKHIHVQRH
jgi:hypothetical protein